MSVGVDPVTDAVDHRIKPGVGRSERRSKSVDARTMQADVEQDTLVAASDHPVTAIGPGEEKP